MNRLVQTVRNTSTTENGAITNRSTLSHVLDFWYHAPAKGTSSADMASIVHMFEQAYGESIPYAIAALFNLRDIRGGKQRRSAFRECLRWLYKNDHSLFDLIVPFVPEYGRWDDITSYTNNASVITLVKEVLKEDNTSDGHVSLLAKWMPSENASSEKTRWLARAWIKTLGMTAREYRKMLSNLRQRINIVERLMSAKKFNMIEYAAVPSQAMKRYRKAFAKRDNERWSVYLGAVEKGEAKINAGTLYPYQITSSIRQKTGEDKALELMWKALPDYMESNKTAMVMVDSSGSMSMESSKSAEGVYPFDIASSLGIYASERARGPFKDLVMSFEGRPQWIDLSDQKTLRGKIQKMYTAKWDGNTNIQLAFELLLSTAQRAKATAEDMPNLLFIISDMEFDAASGGTDYMGRRRNTQTTNFQAIQQQFKDAGYTMPQLVFWNVASRKMQAPVTKDERGVFLASGGSIATFKSVLLSKEVTPIDMMIEVLESPRYAPVLEGVVAYCSQ